MTVFRTFDDLCRAVAQGLQRMPDNLTQEEGRAWCLTQPDLMEVVRLVNVYFEAENNPPEGVIGVGAITYAEQMLLLAQGV